MAKDGDIENVQNRGIDEMKEPFMKQEKTALYEDDKSGDSGNGGSIGMVLLSTFVAVCGSFEFGSCVGYSAPSQAGIREDLGLSLAQYSMFGSILTIGAMIGAITSGSIADFIVRKGAMRVSAAFCIIGWLAVYFSKGVFSLDFGRIFTGYGIGVFSFVVPVFIAEIAPKNLRGGFTTANQLMIVIGASMSFLMGTVVTWRTLALTGLLPCIVLLLGLFFIPESPRWLAKVGRHKEFEVALQSLRGKDADVSHEAAEIQDYLEEIRHLPKARMLDLFQSKYIRSVNIGVGLMVAQQFGGINGVGFYASEAFVLAGLSSGKMGTIAYACLQVPVTILGAILIDKSGRRPLIMVSAIGTFLGCLLAGISFYLKAHEVLLDWVPILALAGVLIFPINVKGVAGGLVTLVNWFGAWAVSYTFNFLMTWSSSGIFFLYSGACAITILFVAKRVPETKGRTLEEIQASINA